MSYAIALLQEKLKNIKSFNNSSEEALSELSTLLMEVVEDSSSLSALEIQETQSVFFYLMLNDKYLFIQRYVLRLSLGNNSSFVSTVKFLYPQVKFLVSKYNDMPPKGLLIFLLIIRSKLPKSHITKKIPAWHIEAIPSFDAEESLLLYNTMFNQKKFTKNIEELQSVLPKIDWVAQWEKYGTKKLKTYLYFWKKGSDTNKIKELYHHLKNLSAEEKTLLFIDFMKLIDMLLTKNGELIKKDPSEKLNGRIHLLRTAVSNYMINPIINVKRKPRVAILLSGQLRGYNRTIQNWRKHLLPNIEADFYVHTWSEIGLSGTEPFRRNLPFSGKKFNLIYRKYCNQIGYADFTKRYPNLFKQISSFGNTDYNLLSELYQTDRIVIEDSDSSVFQGWSNQRKMHYKIMKAQSLLDESGKEYDIVMRLRPDKDIRFLLANWSEICDLTSGKNNLLSDIPYGIHYGSLMIGDQVAVSSQETMRKYSATYSEAYELSKRNMVSMNSFFRGHISLARQCVLNEISVGRFPAIFGGLLPAENLSSELLQQLITLDSINRLDDIDKALLNAIANDIFVSE